LVCKHTIWQPCRGHSNATLLRSYPDCVFENLKNQNSYLTPVNPNFVVWEILPDSLGQLRNNQFVLSLLFTAAHDHFK
jgi:hypothetical protein